MTAALRARLQGRLDPWLAASVIAPLVSFVPFLSGLALGGCFYYRDLATYFYPVRRFVVAGLRAGAIPHWNPYVNEGSPVLLPPVGYPLDLLQALLPGPWGFSLLLALHVPLAALTFIGLARRLGSGPVAAALGALVYALCGFTLSSLNLYVHLQALAWAPLVIWTLLRASSGSLRDVVLAGAALGVCLSTSGVEIAAQALACAFVLAAAREVHRLLRFASGVALGIGLAASPLLGLAAALSAGRRHTGFTVAEALQGSVHPVALLQTLIAGLFGDPVAGASRYWGHPYWGGQPYVASLYLGGAVLFLAAIGAASHSRHRARLVLLLLAGLVVALGSSARLDVALELAPALTRFRYPVKAFFTVTIAAALLASAAADRLLASVRAWRWLTSGCAGLAVALLSLSAFERWLPGLFAGLQRSFFAPFYPGGLRAAALRSIAGDAAAGATALLVIAGLGALVLARRLPERTGVVAVAAVVAADLLRAGAALNPTAHASLYDVSPEMAALATRLRQDGGRAFTCVIHAMPGFREAARRNGDKAGLWTTAVWRETLSPLANVDAGVPTTGFDATAFISGERAFTARETMCADPGTLPRLRAAAVRYIISVEPFRHPELELIAVSAPARAAPLSIFVYRLANSLPDPTVWSSPDDVDAGGRARALDGAHARYVDDGTDSVRLAVVSPRSAWLIVRRTNAAGWSATVDGREAAVSLANGRHQAIPVPAGASEVVLRYRAPGGRLGAWVGVASGCVALALWLASPRRAPGQTDNRVPA